MPLPPHASSLNPRNTLLLLPFRPQSCGSCIEVACDPAWIQDNYGQKLDRTWACYDKQESVVLRVTDTCPCTYPAVSVEVDGGAVVGPLLLRCGVLQIWKGQGAEGRRE